MLDVRTNVLFQRDDYRQLVDISEAKGVSVGNLIRKAVKKQYKLKSGKDYRRLLLKQIQATRELVGVSKTPIDYKALINEGRKY